MTTGLHEGPPRGYVGDETPDYGVSGQGASIQNERILEGMPPGPGTSGAEIILYIFTGAAIASPFILPVVMNPEVAMRVVRGILGQ